MKKQWIAILSVVLMLSVFMNVSINAVADEGTNIAGYNTTDNGTTDMPTFTFVKIFEMLGDAVNGDFPNEDFTIHFIPFDVNGLPYGSSTTIATMPTIADVQITNTMIEGETLVPVSDDKSYKQMQVVVTLPAYTEIGDYWYKVSESVLDEHGVAYDVAGVTHDPNNYYLHVQVVKDPGNNNNLARLVTLHKPDPNNQNTYINAKTNGVTNIYRNGDIIIKKVVNGTVADDDLPFSIKVTMSSTKAVSSDITYKFYDKDNAQKGPAVTIPHDDWNLDNGVYTLEQTIEITANKRVEIYNIPYGVTYTIQEANYSSSYKVPTYNINTEVGEEGDTIVNAHSANWNDKYVSGTISDLEDTITIINTTDATIDVGVIIDNMPYIAIMIFAIGAIVAFVAIRHKKKKVD